MMNIVSRLFSRAGPTLSEAGARDAILIAALHGRSFQRGWSDDEVERLLTERNVVAHRATYGHALAGFVLSRLAAGEAEILSIAVDPSRRDKGIARTLLDLHMRRLAGLGTRAIFLEVAKDNAAALKLYRRAGFREVGQRPAYYQQGRASAVTALVLRRDLT